MNNWIKAILIIVGLFVGFFSLAVLFLHSPMGFVALVNIVVIGLLSGGVKLFLDAYDRIKKEINHEQR